LPAKENEAKIDKKKPVNVKNNITAEKVIEKHIDKVKMKENQQ